jgi:hypothetical protein
LRALAKQPRAVLHQNSVLGCFTSLAMRTCLVRFLKNGQTPEDITLKNMLAARIQVHMLFLGSTAKLLPAHLSTPGSTYKIQGIFPPQQTRPRLNVA